jgi:hypothetical protein
LGASRGERPVLGKACAPLQPSGFAYLAGRVFPQNYHDNDPPSGEAIKGQWSRNEVWAARYSVSVKAVTAPLRSNMTVKKRSTP